MTDRHQKKPYPLRMPDDLRVKLESAAQKGNRSLHAEIVQRLEASFPRDESIQIRRQHLEQLSQTLRSRSDAKERVRNRSLMIEMIQPQILELRKQGMDSEQLQYLLQQRKLAKEKIADDLQFIASLDHKAIALAKLVGDPTDLTDDPILLSSLMQDRRFRSYGAEDGDKNIGARWSARGFGTKHFMVAGDSHSLWQLLVTDGEVLEGDTSLLYWKIETTARMDSGDSGTVWLDIDSDEIPFSVRAAIKSLVGFGVGLVLTHKGKSTLSSPNSFSTELITSIGEAIRGGMIWCPIEKKLMFGRQSTEI